MGNCEVEFMTLEKLTELRRLCEAATQGEWGISLQGETDNYVIKTNEHGDITHYICEGVMDNDLPYIAACNPAAILDLLNTIDRAVEVIREASTINKHDPHYSASIGESAREFLASLEGGDGK